MPHRFTAPVRVGGLALALTGLLMGPAPGRASEGPTPALADGADGAGDATILLCTTPWAPFVETIPPLRPPGPKPDPVVLGFTPPSSAPRAEQTAEGVDPAATDRPAANSGEPMVLPPPVPDALKTEISAGDEDGDEDRDEDGDAPTQTEAQAASVGSVAVVPPDPPLSKRLGRLLVARAAERRRLAASVAADNATALADEVAPTPGESSSHEAGQGATPIDDSDSQAPAPAADGDPPDAEAEAEAEAEAASEQPARADLEDLSMPTARALLPRGRPGGPLSEIVTATCREAGLNCRIALVPWMRPRRQVADGPCDGVFPIEASDQRRGFMTFSNPVAASRLAFFTLGADVREIADMSEYIVLTQGPSDIADSARRAVERIDRGALVLGPDMADLVRRLSGLHPSDKVALYGNYHAILVLMEEIDDIAIPALTVVPHKEQLFRVGFSRDRVAPGAVKAFNAGLRRVLDSPAGRETLESADLSP